MTRHAALDNFRRRGSGQRTGIGPATPAPTRIAVS
jgi:hypothetical protein